MKVIIIGGGASGLMAAINIKRNDISTKVTIIDKNEELGKKILVTGNGRCNLWNEDMNLSNYHSSTNELLNYLITSELINDTYNELSRLFEFKIKNGYYYPYSNKAITVRDILEKECKKIGVEIITNYDVKTISKENEFIINGDLSCDKLIISCGGKSMDITGSDGYLYSLLTDMGHTLVEPLPSLVPLYADEPYLNKWNGIRCDATVSSYINGEYVSSETGELQLTDNGISGICVFNLSNAIVKALKENKYASIQINFMNMTEEETIEYFNNHFNDLTVYEILLKYFDKKLIKIFIDKSGVNQDAYYKSLTTKEISKLVGYLTKFNINITGAGDFYKSQVTQGGISLNDINLDTLESNIIKDLYLIGEVLDVDGKCGGYNLGFAWMSAIKVSDNIC